MRKSDTALFEKFTKLYNEREAFRPTYEAAWERRDDELERRTGIKSHWGFRSEGEAERHLAAMRVVDEEMGFSVVSEHMEELNARLDPVVALITAAPALDLADLALKANAVASACPDLWKSPPCELDYEDGLIRDLIENLCSVAGASLAVTQVRAPTDLN
jgi:hypothetical protein